MTPYINVSCQLITSEFRSMTICDPIGHSARYKLARCSLDLKWHPVAVCYSAHCMCPLLRWQGAVLFTSYTHCLSGTLTRRLHLKHSKFFECGCSRCADPSELGTNFSALRCCRCAKGKATGQP